MLSHRRQKLSRSRREGARQAPLKPPTPGCSGKQRRHAGDAGDTGGLVLGKGDTDRAALRHGVASRRHGARVVISQAPPRSGTNVGRRTASASGS